MHFCLSLHKSDISRHSSRSCNNNKLVGATGSSEQIMNQDSACLFPLLEKYSSNIILCFVST